MEKTLKNVFVLTMTTITVLSLYALADTIVAIALWFFIQFADKSLALQIAKWGFCILFFLEAIPTIPAIYVSVTKDDKEK